MDNEFYSIVEKLAILEGRIASKDKESSSTAKQKKPALFNNLKKEEKTDEMFMPDVGGVPVAEANMEEDVVSKVKASLADYLKSAEEELKQDSDLIKKKKQDLDLKKKELKDLDLQQKAHQEVEEADENDENDEENDDHLFYVVLHDRDEDTTFVGEIYKQDGRWREGNVSGNPPYNWGGTHTYMSYLTPQDIWQHIQNDFRRGFDIAGPFSDQQKALDYAEYEFGTEELDEDHKKLEIGDRVMVMGPNHYQGEFGTIVDFGRGSDFIIVDINGEIVSMHASDVEFHDDQEDWEEELDENPTEAPPQSASGSGGNPTYAESATAPVKTVHVPVECGDTAIGGAGGAGGGTLLVELHGDERDGFCIKRAGRELPTRFKTLAEAELALEMYVAHRKTKHDAEQSTDYLEEK
jgi:hypothetical protein